MSKKKSKAENDIAQAGLPGADPHVEAPLIQAGIDPDRLSIFKFGQKPLSVTPHLSPWTKRLLLGLILWLSSEFLQATGILPESFFHASLSLLIGLIVLQVACEALLKATKESPPACTGTITLPALLQKFSRQFRSWSLLPSSFPSVLWWPLSSHWSLFTTMLWCLVCTLTSSPKTSMENSSCPNQLPKLAPRF